MINPTGNVITDEELMKLDRLANQHGIPLVIDNAYGVPFLCASFLAKPGRLNHKTVLHEPFSSGSRWV